mgnify:CR=1 FL=1
MVNAVCKEDPLGIGEDSTLDRSAVVSDGVCLEVVGLDFPEVQIGETFQNRSLYIDGPDLIFLLVEVSLQRLLLAVEDIVWRLAGSVEV